MGAEIESRRKGGGGEGRRINSAPSNAADSPARTDSKYSFEPAKLRKHLTCPILVHVRSTCIHLYHRTVNFARKETVPVASTSAKYDTTSVLLGSTEIVR
jgi:hypothetical protein